MILSFALQFVATHYTTKSLITQQFPWLISPMGMVYLFPHRFATPTKEKEFAGEPPANSFSFYNLPP
jgi:hypothetical protein